MPDVSQNELDERAEKYFKSGWEAGAAHALESERRAYWCPSFEVITESPTCGACLPFDHDDLVVRKRDER